MDWASLVGHYDAEFLEALRRQAKWSCWVVVDERSESDGADDGDNASDDDDADVMVGDDRRCSCE